MRKKSIYTFIVFLFAQYLTLRRKHFLISLSCTVLALIVLTFELYVRVIWSTLKSTGPVNLSGGKEGEHQYFFLKLPRWLWCASCVKHVNPWAYFCPLSIRLLSLHFFVSALDSHVPVLCRASLASPLSVTQD